jgi:DNA-binding transcriptional LysR family regulator
MDCDWLEDFIALMECGGFSRAAESRAVSQPSFSRRIRALEEWVGATLVDRSTHRVRLTDAGERFRMVAEETLRRLQLGREEARAIAKASSESLRFASTHVLSLTFFPAFLRRLEARIPMTARIELTADNMTACEKIMVEGRAQFLLCHHHEAAPTRLGSDFCSILLGHDILLPVASPGLASAGPLDQAPQLSFSSESGMGRILAAAWATAGAEPPAPTVFSSHLASVLTMMAREGRGVAWSAMSILHEDLESGRLVRVGGADDEVRIEIRLWRPRARQSLAAEALWARLLKGEGSDRLSVES